MTAGSEPQHSTVAAPELVELAQVLSKARCEQGLSQEDLAQRLHMGLEQLQAFEAADPERLPESVYVIAQARRLADALGVEVEPQIQALRRCSSFAAAAAPLRAEVFAQAAREQPLPRKRAGTADTAAPRTPGSGVRGASRTALLGLLILIAVGAGGIGLWQQLSRGSKPPTTPAAGLAPGSAPAESEPQAQTPARVLSPEPSSKATDQAAREQTAGSDVLVLMATAPCWLEVRPIQGGPPLFRGTLRGEKRLPLGQGLRVRAGRPDQLLVRRGDGEARPLGTISQIRWVSFRPAPPAASAAPTPEQRRL